MSVIVNTTFFYNQALKERVHQELALRWLPACAAAGCAAPDCLELDPEGDVARLAVHTPFVSRAEAEAFAAEVIPSLTALFVKEFGEQNFVAFYTIMNRISLL